ncbi:MAG: hypothetical protein V9G22_01100 [Ottowia sp.]
MLVMRRVPFALLVGVGRHQLLAVVGEQQSRQQGFDFAARHALALPCSVFVDASLQPYPDQWAFLASVARMPAHDIEPTILRATGGAHPLDVTFIDDEDLATPWKRESKPAKLAGLMPKSLTVILANQIYFEKVQLPQALANRLIRLAAFQNPEFYRAQAMRMSVWNKPRIIGCAENFPQHIALPRGCFDAACDLLADNGIRLDLRDERHAGTPIAIGFSGTLRPDQEAAVAAMLLIFSKYMTTVLLFVRYVFRLVPGGDGHGAKAIERGGQEAVARRTDAAKGQRLRRGGAGRGRSAPDRVHVEGVA